MGQLTIRMGEKDLAEMDNLVKKEGLETRSELIRRAWTAYKKIKNEESKGKVLVITPAEQASNTPMLFSL